MDTLHTQLVYRVAGAGRTAVIDAAGNLAVTLNGVGVTAALLPAAAALADNLSNPTTTQIGADNLVWDSTISTWARLYSFRGAGDAGPGSVAAAMGMMAYNGGGASVGTDRWYNRVASRTVSATNTAQIVTLTTFNLHDTLAIHSAASASTATLVVDVSVDGTNFLTLDSLAAAATQIKQYTAATVGASIALSPLSFPIIRITAGTAGVGNTTTLTLVVK